MTSVNETLLNEQIGHATDLRRYTPTVVHRMLAILNRADVALFSELASRMAGMDSASFTMQWLESIMFSVRNLISVAYNQLGRELTVELLDLTKYELSNQASMLRAVLPIQIHFATVTPEAVYAAAMARPFQGNLLKGFIAELEASKAKLIRTAIADGYVQGKTTDQIVRSLRGTKARGYADGLLEISRRNAQSLVLTALAHTSAFARNKSFEANSDLIKGYLWIATLDNKTSAPCRVRDHKQYNKAYQPVGHSIPWGAGPGALHFCCRSVATLILKSWEELGSVIDVPEFKPSERASMDGAIPAETDYATWLAKQSADRQDDVLGPTRGKLMRDGNLSLADMYSAKGSPLTLDEMRIRDASAFKKAGVD